MPGDANLVGEFAGALKPAIVGHVFQSIVDEMRLAGEMGSLLPV
jgi:hypothetical protein